MKRKKMFYVPGLISLIGLPILLFIVNPEDKVQQTVMKINILSDDTTKFRISSIVGLDSIISGKKIEQINLNDNIEDYLYDDLDQYLSTRKQQFLIHELRESNLLMTHQPF